MPRLRLTIGCSLGSLKFDVCLSLCSLSDPVVVIHGCRPGVRAMNRTCSTIQIYFWVLGSFLLVIVRLIQGSNAWVWGPPCKTLVLRETAEAESQYLLVGFPIPNALQCLLFARLSDLFEGVLMRYAERERQCTEGGVVGQNCNMWTFPRTVGVEVGHV